GHLVQLLDEDRALRLQALDDIFIMDDLMAHIDRRTMDPQRLLHSVDGPHHAGAEAAWLAQQDAQGWLFGNVHRGVHQRPGHTSWVARQALSSTGRGLLNCAQGWACLYS